MTPQPEGKACSAKIVFVDPEESRSFNPEEEITAPLLSVLTYCLDRRLLEAP